MDISNSVIPAGFSGPGSVNSTNISQSGGQKPKERPTDLPGVEPGGPIGGGAYNGQGGGFFQGGQVDSPLPSKLADSPVKGTARNVRAGGNKEDSLTDISQGFGHNTGTESPSIIDGSGSGLSSDGQGNWTWNFNSMTTPGGSTQSVGETPSGNKEATEGESVTNAPLTMQDFQPDSTVNFVDDLNADSTGESPSDGALSALNGLKEKVRVEVPSGNYSFSQTPHSLSGPAEISMVATDGEVTFSPQKDGVFLDATTPLALKGVNIAAPNPSPEIKLTSKKFLLTDTTLVGEDTADKDGATFTLEVSQGGTGVFRNVTTNGGATNANRAGIKVTPQSKGSVWLEKVNVSNYTDGGVLSAQSGGQLTVLGGTYVNNSRAQIEMSDPQVLIDHATVKVDSNYPYTTPTTGIKNVGFPEQYESTLTDSASEARKTGTIRNCLMEIANSNATVGYVANGLGGGQVITRTHFDMSTGVPAIKAEAPGDSASNRDMSMQISDISVIGSSTSGTMVDVKQRKGSFLRDSCIEENADKIAHTMPTESEIKGITKSGCSSRQGNLGQASNPNTGTV